jgi:hypothetical protein
VGDDELVRVQRHALLGMAAVQQLAQRLVAAHQRAGDLRRFELAHGPRAERARASKGNSSAGGKAEPRGTTAASCTLPSSSKISSLTLTFCAPGRGRATGGGSGREAWRVRT